MVCVAEQFKELAAFEQGFSGVERAVMVQRSDLRLLGGEHEMEGCVSQKGKRGLWSRLEGEIRSSSSEGRAAFLGCKRVLAALGALVVMVAVSAWL